MDQVKDCFQPPQSYSCENTLKAYKYAQKVDSIPENIPRQFQSCILSDGN
jgi:hypothetical protein